MARIATDAKPGEAHAESESSHGGTSEADVALEAPGEAGELQGDTAERTPGPRSAARRGATQRRAALLAGRDADRRRARHRPRPGRGHRPRRARAQAGRARVHGVRRRATRRAADAHRVALPARRAGGAAQAEVAARAPRAGARAAMPAGRQRPAVAHAAVDRRAHEGVAAHRGDLHDDRRGRHDPRRGVRARARASRRSRTRRAPRSTRCGSSRSSTRRSRATTYTTYDGVHLGIAVSLGEDGLIVPVIRDAQDLSVEGLAARIKDLARRARSNAADPGRGPRRHVHDHQPGRLRLDPRHPGDQPAAGRDPRHGGDRQARPS